MKLSNLLPEHVPQYAFEVFDEKEFETLGLVGSDPGMTKCTFLDRPEFAEDIPDDVRMVITNKEIAELVKAENRGICIVEDPRIVFFKLHNAMSKVPPYARDRKPTVIGRNCKISPHAIISDENVVIGDNVQIDEFVVIRDNVTIGDNCIIRSGVKIGEPDFEFKREGDTVFGVEHLGGVIIGKDVEILSNTGVNKALYPWDDTVIGDYVKIDMLCNISHGAKVGDETMIVALSGIGGRTVVGKKCWIGYGTILRNGITIGDNARVNMGAVVSRDVNDDQAVTGNFAIDHDLFMEDLKAKVKRNR